MNNVPNDFSGIMLSSEKESPPVTIKDPSIF